MKHLKWYKLSSIKIFIFCVFTLLSQVISAQKEYSFFFNEINISANYTNVSNSNTENKLGFGASLYRIQKSENKPPFVFGIEYNMTNQMKKEMYENHYSHSTDITLRIQSITLPIGIRLDLMKSKAFFIQLLGFFELTTGARKSGWMHTYLPDGNNTIIYKDFSFKESMKLSTFNFGIIPGFGYYFPIFKNKKSGLLKLEYQWGIKNLSYDLENIFNKTFRLSLGIHLF